jgi:hypothetical protein
MILLVKLTRNNIQKTRIESIIPKPIKIDIIIATTL